MRDGGDAPDINVDLHGLKEFGTRMRGDLDRELRPGTARIAKDFQWGVSFGLRTASKEVIAAVLCYHSCLKQATKLMADYIREAEIIVQAATAVATAYGDADALSSARTEQVELAFATASWRARQAANAAEAARLASERAAQDSEDRFLRGRR